MTKKILQKLFLEWFAHKTSDPYKNGLWSRESKDGKKQVLVSAHSPPKLCQKSPHTETYITQTLHMLDSSQKWQNKDIGQKGGL